MTTANTNECWTEFIGQKVTGVLFGALPVNSHDLARGTYSLIFEDGRALTVSSKGTFWVETAEHVGRAVRRKEAELRAVQSQLAGVLSVAEAVEPG